MPVSRSRQRTEVSTAIGNAAAKRSRLAGNGSQTARTTYSAAPAVEYPMEVGNPKGVITYPHVRNALTNHVTRAVNATRPPL